MSVPHYGSAPPPPYGPGQQSPYDAATPHGFVPSREGGSSMPSGFGPPEYTERSAEPGRPRTRIVPVIVAGLVGLLVGVLGTLGAVAVVNIVAGAEDPVAAVDQGTDTTDRGAGTAEGAGDTPPDDDPADLAGDAAYEPTVDDFDVSISIKEQSCFGSAGCNVTLRTEPEYIGTQVPSGSWEVTYEITGIEDSPMIRTFDLVEDQFSFDPEAFVGTTTADAEIDVEITAVSEGF